MEIYSLEEMGFNDRYSLNEKIHVNFFIANRMLERSIEILDTLPPGQVRTLAAINYLEEPTQQKVLEIMNIRAASLSEMLSKLEKRGYLIRTKDSNDKRIVIYIIIINQINYRRFFLTTIKITNWYTILKIIREYHVFLI